MGGNKQHARAPSSPSGRGTNAKTESKESKSKMSMKEKALKMNQDMMKLKRDMENAYRRGTGNLKNYWAKAKTFAEKAKRKAAADKEEELRVLKEAKDKKDAEAYKCLQVAQYNITVKKNFWGNTNCTKQLLEAQVVEEVAKAG